MHTIKEYREVDVQVHSFLSLALTGAEQSTSCPSLFTASICRIGASVQPRVSVDQRFANFFQVGTTFISQNVLRTTLLLSPLKANCLRFLTIVCDTQFTLILFFCLFLTNVQSKRTTRAELGDHLWSADHSLGNAGVDNTMKTEISCPCWESTHDSSAVQSIALFYLSTNSFVV
jgi:hypothetical protein